jgi:hypothetical protein
MMRDWLIKLLVCSSRPIFIYAKFEHKKLVRLTAFRLVEAGLEHKPGIESKPV